MAERQRLRIFQGVESSLWTLAEPPVEKTTKDRIRSTMLMNQAITVLLAEAYPKPLTVFEIAVDLVKHWRDIPLGLDDQHSTVYKNLSGGAKFIEVTPRSRSKS